MATDDIDDCLKIEPLAIEEEYIRTPADLAYWNEQYAEAFLAWKKSKLAREQLWHALFKELGDALRDERGPGVRVTVAETEAAVTTDARYLEACTSEIMAETEKVRLHGVMDALRTKRDMLISLGAHLRTTMEQDLLIRTREHLDSQGHAP